MVITELDRNCYGERREKLVPTKGGLGEGSLRILYFGLCLTNECDFGWILLEEKWFLSASAWTGDDPWSFPIAKCGK